MKDNFLSLNNSYDENEEEVNNSLFQCNRNSLFQKEDSSFNYFNNIGDLNGEEDEQMNNNHNEYNLNDIDNNNFENDFQDKKSIFHDNDNNINKSFSLMSPIPGNEDNSYKLINNNNFENNEISKEEMFKEGSLSGAGTDDTPLSTGGTGLKNQSKDNSFNNSNINNNNKINNNFIAFINEKINNNNKVNNKKGDKSVLSKKRKQRIHLEDLNIDPEIIKYKKYQTIGDKVILKT